MGMGNLTLNVMSLGGIALGMGVLLDNAIVMLENIYRRRATDGLDAEEGAHVGAAEVTSPIVAATVTSLASVVPFLLITGLSALVFRELILTVSISHLASLPVALTLVPMLAAQLGKIKFTSGLEHFGPLVAFDRGFNRMIGRYRKIVGGAVKHPYLVLASAVALCVGAGFVARTFDAQFLPMVDDGIVTANLRLPPGTPPTVSNQVTLGVEEITKQMPGVLHVYANAGFGRGGNLDILLKPVRERGMSAERGFRNCRSGWTTTASPPRVCSCDRRAFAACERRAPVTPSRSTCSATISVSSMRLDASCRNGSAVFPASRISTYRRTKAVRSSPLCSTASAPAPSISTSRPSARRCVRRSMAPSRRGTRRATSSTTCVCSSRGTGSRAHRSSAK
jgi:hypothetical protein